MVRRKGMAMVRLLMALGAMICSVAMVGTAAADIYKYEDDNGVLHFTDAPADTRFKIFWRDIKRDKQLRTTFRLGGFNGNPKEFDPLIESYAREYGVDTSLVKAVIHAESGYNPAAVSNKGAMGLMQLMPKTAQDLKVDNCFNPSQNIRGGVKYLRFLLDTFKGDVQLAVAAYNAGLSRVAKYGGIPPFEETRNYVAKVLSYQQTYRNQ
jgi:soluble lytic murein transglycosylase-like protein